MARSPFLTTLPPLTREATVLPLRWRGLVCRAGACPITMPLTMHCNMLCHHSGCPAECALVTVPGVIIAMAMSLPLPLAGVDVPTTLPVQALGMHSHRARPHHCTRHRHCHIWCCVVLVIYVSWHIYANFLAALAKLVGLGPVQYEDYAGGLRPSAIVSYLASFPYPVLLTPVLVLHCQM
jgi:hypothetical protein